MSDDLFEYLKALVAQDHKRVRYLGVANEKCPSCGRLIETLLNSSGKNPLRCCWYCEIKSGRMEAEFPPTD